MYDLFLFQGRNSLFEFQYATDKHFPVQICTKSKEEEKKKKKRAHAWANGSRTRVMGPDFSLQCNLYCPVHSVK